MATRHALHRPFRRVIRCLPAELQQYRYLLEVQVAETAQPLACLLVILKNPSAASATRSDPTVGKVEAWARAHGFGRVIYTNLFAYRSSVPSALHGLPYELIVGPENDEALRQAGGQADVVVAAWGNPHGIDRVVYDRRIREVLEIIRGQRLFMVGSQTRLGYPRHGLFWRLSWELQPAWPFWGSGKPKGAVVESGQHIVQRAGASGYGNGEQDWRAC